MKSSIPPPLYPNKLKRHCTLLTLRGLAKFLQTYGFWPRTAELAMFMKTSKYAAQWYLDELLNLELVERYRRRASVGVLQITPRGWAALGFKPLDPYRPRPTGRRKQQLAMKVTANVIRDLSAQRIKENNPTAQSTPPEVPA